MAQTKNGKTDEQVKDDDLSKNHQIYCLPSFLPGRTIFALGRMELRGQEGIF
jgi:hypothetical protein